MDGAPPLGSRQREARWYAVTEAEFLRLVGNSQRGEATVLDQYGSNNRAEFFAVATECFFELPHAVRQRHGELSRVLQDFYQQDPCAWLPESPADRGAIRRAEDSRLGRSRDADRFTAKAPEDWPERTVEEVEDEDRARLRAYRAMSAPDALFTLALEHLYGNRFEDATRVFTS